jgi:hypothetical protein
MLAIVPYGLDEARPCDRGLAIASDRVAAFGTAKSLMPCSMAQETASAARPVS